MAATANTIVKTVTIASGQSLSAELDLEGFKLVCILMPAAWDAAAITFQISDVAGGTFLDAFDDAGVEISATVDAARAVGFDDILPELSSVRFMKLRSGTSATPVNQTASRTFKILAKT